MALREIGLLYALGRLEEDDVIAFEIHLLTCQKCRHAAEEAQGLIESIVSLPAIVAILDILEFLAPEPRRKNGNVERSI